MTDTPLTVDAYPLADAMRMARAAACDAVIWRGQRYDLPPADLADARVNLARLVASVPRSTRWIHVKGDLYVVRAHGLREHDLEPCVIYARYRDHIVDGIDDAVLWIRPGREFLRRFQPEGVSAR